MAQSSLDATQPTNLNALLSSAQKLDADGESDRAYKFALEATRKAPGDVEAWLWRAETAPSVEEKLICLSQLYALDPYFFNARPKMYKAFRDLIQHEPFLSYIEETDELYRVKSRIELYVNVPKARARPEPYPSLKSNELKSTHRLLALASIFLLLGGLVTIFLAPLVVVSALFALVRPLTRRDHVRALVALLAAVLIWLAALPISYLFILHLVQ